MPGCVLYLVLGQVTKALREADVNRRSLFGRSLLESLDKVHDRFLRILPARLADPDKLDEVDAVVSTYSSDVVTHLLGSKREG